MLMTTWRVIDSGPGAGAMNMAVDEALLLSCIAGNDGFPTLRFFGWQRPTLSIGIMQGVEAVRLDVCKERDIPLIRRPTGGKAVLHQHELTYSLVGSDHDPLLSGNVVESYRKISGALLAALASLGVQAELAPPGSYLATSRSDHPAACFEQPADYELSVGGRKLIGSAQARRRGALLQQGSILLAVDLPLLVSVLNYGGLADEVVAENLRQRITSVAEAVGLPEPPDYATMVATMRAAFSAVMGAELAAGDLSTAEQATAERLRREKYATDAWTLLR